MELDTQLHQLAWCLLTLHKIYLDLDARSVEAVEFRHKHHEFNRLASSNPAEIEAWLEKNKRSTVFTNEELYVHFREEYSTYGFALEALFERVGFEILESTFEDDFYTAYTCRWQGCPEWAQDVFGIFLAPRSIVSSNQFRTNASVWNHDSADSTEASEDDIQAH